MADFMKFVSKSELDAKKEKRREERESVLRNAKETYDRKQKELEEKKERGEDVWMLPSLSKRLSASSSEDESSKHSKHKGGKKKKKKKKKKMDKSDSEDEWIEKDAESSAAVEKKTKTSGTAVAPQRESWMLFPLSSKHEKKYESVVLCDKEEPKADSKKEPVTDEMGQHPKELNPYWKKGSSGLPSAKSSDRDSISSNRAWFKRAYERAKQQAEDEGRSLEDVAAERWGSLEKLKTLAGENSKERHGSKGRNKDGGCNKRSETDNSGRKERRSDYNYNERSKRGHSQERDFERRGFRKPDDGRRETIKKLRKPREDNVSSTASSSKFNKKYEMYRNEDRNKKPTERWRKKQYQEVSQEEITKSPDTEKMVNKEKRDSTSSSSSEEEEEEEEHEKNEKSKQDRNEEKLISKRVTEADLNSLAAKRLKAELIGDEELAQELDARLDKLKKIKEEQEKGGTRSRTEEEDENLVILTRTDRSGNVVPVEQNKRSDKTGKRRNRHKQVATHDEDGKRSRYFCDDDNYDLNSLVAREKMSTAEDQNATYARLAHKLGGQFDLDDKFESAAASKYTPEELEEKARQKAVREHQRLAAQMENCKYCLDSRDLDKHLIIAIGLKVYLALPSNKSLCDGHCLLIPIMHHCAGTMIDEDVWSEIQIFKKGLTKLFLEMGKDVVFMEMYRQINKRRHMFIECIPVQKDIGDMAPIYFKKAIQECDSEWAQNKKLIDTRKKSLRSSVPKGLPYFSVEFGLDGGFAHVIENEDLVPSYFGKEIVGGMLELEPFIWKKPQKETFQVQKKKVLQFADWWQPYDWTQKIKKK